MGTGTKFMDQLASGDAVIITHPTTLQQETRIVTMVLSNVSIAISSAFSSDLISNTRFTFIKKPRDLVAEGQAAEANKKKKKKEDEALAFGTYVSTTVI